MAFTTITVAGITADPKFQRSRVIAQALCETHPDRVQICVMEFFECQWQQFLKKTANCFKGVFYDHAASPLIYLNEQEYVGDGEAFQTWALHTFNHKDGAKQSEYDQMASDAI